MIQSLYIRNYVLIDKLEMQFSDGFTTITGETGAGKSILMGALGLILGQRVDTSVLKLKDAKCIVEGSFRIEPEMESIFTARELDFERFTTIRREISPGGKSRAFVNDTPVTLPVLKELGARLVDIHSQHQSLQVGDYSYQMEVVDYLGQNSGLLAEYRDVYQAYRELGSRIEEIRKEAQRMKEDLDYMQFQFNELKSAQLKEGELEDLEADFQRAEHAEEIGNALKFSSSALVREDSGILDQLKEILNQLQKISPLYNPAREMTERLESAYIEIKDLYGVIEEQSTAAVDLEPGSLDQLQERIDLLYGLMQKHRVREVGELITMRDELDSKIEELTFSDEKLDGLEKEKARLVERMDVLSSDLHESRSKAGKSMEGALVTQLRELGIPHARFKVEVHAGDEFHERGKDEVRFLFSANKQVDVEEISHVASGGEISRLMLCIKALISDRKAMPTLIFDEIDTGVGGEIAERFGKIMAELAAKRQVVAITHLPQVASMGSDHFVVYKEDTDHANYTRIRRLEEHERIEEIARMLSGASVTQEALSNARVLLKV